MSRNGFAMACPYPFFAGAEDEDGFGALADFACPAAGCPTVAGAISAEIWKPNVCTPVALSSCFDSLISTFWKYPERFMAVMKFATELMDEEEPSSASAFPLRVMDVSHKFSVRETVLAIMSSNS